MDASAKLETKQLALSIQHPSSYHGCYCAATIIGSEIMRSAAHFWGLPGGWLRQGSALARVASNVGVAVVAAVSRSKHGWGVGGGGPWTGSRLCHVAVAASHLGR